MSGKAGTVAARAADRMKTRAIAQYVHDWRETLKKAIDDFEKLDKNARRNELLREGRKRFSKEGRDVQYSYLHRIQRGRVADHQRSGACGGAGSGEKQPGCGGASAAEKEPAEDHARPSRTAASSGAQQQQQQQ